MAVLATASITANAQNGFDFYEAPRTVVLATPQTILAGSALVTNGPVDTHGFVGTAAVNIFSLTNVAGAAITAQIYSSPDQTNLTALSGYALSTSTSISVTNRTYGGGTNLYATSTYLLPGVLTTPDAPTAGWATPYIAPAKYTNSGAVTITSKGVYQIGFNAADVAGRYLYVVFNSTGTATNNTVSAILTGRRGAEVGTR